MWEELGSRVLKRSWRIQEGVLNQFAWSAGQDGQIGACREVCVAWSGKPSSSSCQSGTMEKSLGNCCLCVVATSEGLQLSSWWCSWGHCWPAGPSVGRKSWTQSRAKWEQAGTYLAHLHLFATMSDCDHLPREKAAASLLSSKSCTSSSFGQL